MVSSVSILTKFMIFFNFHRFSGILGLGAGMVKFRRDRRKIGGGFEEDRKRMEGGSEEHGRIAYRMA